MIATQDTFKRYEKKYLLSPTQYEALRAALEPYMGIDSYGRSTICNIYYDTDQFDLIRTSIEKPVYKEKLRLRSYGTPDTETKVFMELKKKYKGVVYKRRESLPLWQARDYLDRGIAPERDSQILREIGWFLKTWPVEPKVFLAYERTALFGREDANLRITFDENIRWRDTDLDLRRGDHGARILPDDRYLMEIKIPGAIPLWISRMLSDLCIYSTSFSKYGACYQQNLASSVAKGVISCA